MRRWVVLGITVAISGLVATAVWSQGQAPASKPTELIKTALTGDATRDVRIINVDIPPGSDSGRHFHHGDQYTTVQEGEIHITIDGKGDHAYKAGDAVHIEPMLVHRTQNLSGKPARTLEVFIVDKSKPMTEKVQ